MILGVVLALAAALATNLAFLFKYRGAVRVAPIRARHPLRSAAALFRSKWFAVGWLIAILAWALHVGALARAPLSIVQAVLSGGLVFLAVLAERFFDLRLGRWQWFGVTITAVGLAIIGLTGSGAAKRVPHRDRLGAGRTPVLEQERHVGGQGRREGDQQSEDHRKGRAVRARPPGVAAGARGRGIASARTAPPRAGAARVPRRRCVAAAVRGSRERRPTRGRAARACG